MVGEKAGREFDRTICLTEGFPRIVCLCGSCRFKDLYIQANEMFTDAGWIVLTVGRFMPQDQQDLQPQLKERLDLLHLRKIDLSDCVYVIDGMINDCPYVGRSTQAEIAHAEERGRPVVYMSKTMNPIGTCIAALRGESAEPAPREATQGKGDCHDGG